MELFKLDENGEIIPDRKPVKILMADPEKVRQFQQIELKDIHERYTPVEIPIMKLFEFPKNRQDFIKKLKKSFVDIITHQ